MSYLLKSSPRPKRKRVILAIVIILACLLLFLVLPSVSRGLSSGLQSIGVPLWRLQVRVTTATSFILSPFRLKATLVRENNALREKLEEQALHILEQEGMERENRELRALLGRSEEPQRIVAGVLKRPGQLPYDTLILDAGVKNGVFVGDKVVVRGVAIGEISSVLARTSTALLYSSPGKEEEVLVGSTATAVQAVGRGGGNFEAQIPRGITVAEGDSVELPGLSGGQLGVVEAVIDKPTDSFIRILFKLPVNLRELRFVEIVLTYI